MRAFWRKENPHPQVTDKNGIKWKYYGEGKFNWVYKTNNTLALPSGRTSTGPSVLKVNKRFSKGGDSCLTVMDTPERSIRLMSEINSNLAGSYGKYSCEVDGSSYTGWVMPFIKGKKPTDKELAEAVRRIYQKTQRIVFDALSPGNFIKMSDGEVICVDFALAVRRRNSDASEQYLTTCGERCKNQWRNQAAKEKFPETAFCLEVLVDLDEENQHWEDDQVRRREFQKAYDTKFFSKTLRGKAPRSAATFRKVKLNDVPVVSEHSASRSVSSPKEAAASLSPAGGLFNSSTLQKEVGLSEASEPLFVEEQAMGVMFRKAESDGLPVKSTAFCEVLDLVKRCKKEVNKDLFEQLIYLLKKEMLFSRANKKTELTPFNHLCEFAKQAKELEDLLGLGGNSNVIVKANCVFEEVMTLAKNPKIELSDLTGVLKDTRELISFDSDFAASIKSDFSTFNKRSTKRSKDKTAAYTKRLNNYRANAKKMSGKRSWGKRLGGAMLALLGAVVVVISAVAMIKSCGLLTPLALPCAKFGTTIAAKGLAMGHGALVPGAGGACMMWKSRRRGLSKAMMKLADASATEKEDAQGEAAVAST